MLFGVGVLNAATELALHGGYKRKEAGDLGWDKESFGDDGASARYFAKVHGVEREVERRPVKFGIS